MTTNLKKLRWHSIVNLGLVAVSTITCFLLLELAFRAYFNSVDQRLASGEIPYYIQLLPNSQRLYGFKPLLGTPFNTNSLGFRGTEVSLAKDPDTFRILMLGDSITFAGEVNSHETFSYMLEQMLNSTHEDKSFEVLNFGVIGYNTRQEVATFIEVGLAYAPDVVLLNICLNDSDPPKSVVTAGLKNVASITKASDINLRTIVDSSYLFTFVKSKTITLLKKNENIIRTLNSPSLFIDPRVKEAAWRDMKDEIERLRKISQSNGILFGAVIYPYSSQIGLTDDERIPQRDLKDFFESSDVPVLDPLKSYQEAEHDMFADNVLHLSAYGHEKIAAAIYDFFVSSGLCPKCSNSTTTEKQ